MTEDEVLFYSNIGSIVAWKYPHLVSGVHYLVQDDGSGPYIKAWNTPEEFPTFLTMRDHLADWQKYDQTRIARKKLKVLLDAFAYKEVYKQKTEYLYSVMGKASEELVEAARAELELLKSGLSNSLVVAVSKGYIDTEVADKAIADLDQDFIDESALSVVKD